MLKKLLVVFILIFLFLDGFVKEASSSTSHNIALQDTEEIQFRKLDPRAKILAAYLAQFKSPLEYHAQDFIDAADSNNMDWKLVPSIAGVESTFGKHIPTSYGYNAWGWGVYGDQALGFSSWRDGIFTVSTGLKKNYIDKGLTEPYAMNRVYASSKTWGAHVSYFLADLTEFEKNYPKENQLSSVQPKIAGSSAQPASI